MMIYKLNEIDLRMKGLDNRVYSTLSAYYRHSFGDFKAWRHEVRFVIPKLVNRYNGKLSPEELSNNTIIARNLVINEIKEAAPVFRTHSMQDEPLPGFMMSKRGLLMVLDLLGIKCKDKRFAILTEYGRIDKDRINDWSPMLWRNYLRTEHREADAVYRTQHKILYHLFPDYHIRKATELGLREKGVWK